MSEWTQTNSRMSCTMGANIKLTIERMEAKNVIQWPLSMPQEKADKLGYYTHQKHPSKGRSIWDIFRLTYTQENSLWAATTGGKQSVLQGEESVQRWRGWNYNKEWRAIKRVNQTSYWLHKLIIP